MKDLLCTLVTIIAVIIITSYILIFIDIPKEIATSVSASLVVLFPQIHKAIAKSTTKKKQIEISNPIMTYSGFGQPVAKTIFYCTAVFSGIIEASGVVIILFLLSGFETECARSCTIFFNSVVSFLAAFYIGYWVGANCFKCGVISIVVIAIASRLFTATVDFVAIPLEAFKMYTGFNKEIMILVSQVVFGSIALSAVSFIGYRYGRRKRLSHYLIYLLKSLPLTSQTAILDLAYEEAAKAVRKGA